MPAKGQIGPQDRDSAVSAAGIRILGGTQREAAEAVGVDRTTVQRWESSDWWGGVLIDARARLGDKLIGFAHRAILNAVREGDARIALAVLERLDPATWSADERARGISTEVTGPRVFRVVVPEPVIGPHGEQDVIEGETE